MIIIMPQKTYESFLCPESNFLKLNCNDDEERRRSDLEQHRDWAIPAWHLDNNVTVMLQWCDGWWQPISLLWRGKETDCCIAPLLSSRGIYTKEQCILNRLANDSHNSPWSEVEAEAPSHSWRARWPRMCRRFGGSHVDTSISLSGYTQTCHWSILTLKISRVRPHAWRTAKLCTFCDWL